MAKSKKKVVKELTSTDVAHMLDLSPDEVCDMARRGRLRARKEGRQWRYLKRDVNRFAGAISKR